MHHIKVTDAYRNALANVTPDKYDGRPLAQGEYVGDDGRVWFSAILYWQQHAARQGA